MFLDCLYALFIAKRYLHCLVFALSANSVQQELAIQLATRSQTSYVQELATRSQTSELPQG